ncbi:hypothetical protein C8F04DRAFT_978254, partial [Mycena alexandri]
MASSLSTAVLELPAGKMPLLHEGETSQAQLRQFEVHAKNYFSLKKVAAADHVAHVIGCFRDFRVTDELEIESERAAALALDFKKFMDKIRGYLLPSDWERRLRQQVNQRKQGTNETFTKFATAVRSANSLLINTPSYVDDARIRTILEANMVPDLIDDLIDDDKAAGESDFTAWLDIVKHIDDKRLRQGKRLRDIAAEERERAKRERNTSNTNDERPAKRNRRDENTAPSSSSTNAAGGKRCPKLTEAERDLLNANHGCTKCRVPFVAHADDRDKSCDFPAAAGYKTVTRAVIDAAAAALTAEQRKQFGVAPAKTKPVAAVLDAAAVAATGFASADEGDVD